uniref:Si:dkey-224e22.2 n=1 Tax=Oryzias sinensis TaxID=183150 RepID=A0A8C7XRL8_9TELE
MQFDLFLLLRNQPEVKMHQVIEGLKADSSNFTLERKPFLILGGSIHYFRVPKAYWEDRLLKLKACGLNTLTTYVPWNLHEPERGVFDFEGELDLEAYLGLAASLGIWVILRPGPYICAEWDLGGLPSWLLRDQNMRLRTTYPGFTAAVDSYFDHLIKKVAPYQYSRGGPIIAVQVENEYGSYATDEEYMPFIKEALLSRGITELLVTSDNKDGLKLGGVKGALETINFQKLDPEEIKYLEKIQPQKPKMVMEYWSGWFDLWGGLHHVFPAEEMMAVVTEILKLDMSINLYMFHGGTNFGFMSGAFAVGRPSPAPMVTSYDYDAPLSEAGDYTTKYHLLRNLFSHHHRECNCPFPSFSLFFFSSLYSCHRTEKPVNMENLPVNNNNGQAYGYTLYETIISSGGSLKSLNNIRDRALVRIRTTAKPRSHASTWMNESLHRHISVNVTSKAVKRVLVLVKLVFLFLFSYRLQSSAQWKSMREKPSFPAFFQTKLYLSSSPKDTFLKLPGWSKGVVFVNGKNLGRYWSVGPQQTLYVPGAWLSRWDNEVLHLTFNYLLLSRLFSLVLSWKIHNLDYKHRAQ